PAHHELSGAPPRVGALAVPDDVLARENLDEQVAAAADVADLEVGDLQVRRPGIRPNPVEARLRFLRADGERRRRQRSRARGEKCSSRMLVVVHCYFLTIRVSDTIFEEM